MAQTDTLTTRAERWRKGDGKGLALAILMTFVIGGTLPIISYISRPLAWSIWGLIFISIILYSKELPLKNLIKPALPYLLWLSCFIVWGVIVAPVSVIQQGIKVVITTFVITLAMAIITSKLQYLRYFANALQWAIFVNLMLIPIGLISSRASSMIASINATTSLYGEAYEVGISRFAGLWGNPNMAGYICLVAIILSVWSTPWVAWIGRLSAVPVIYFTASRKSMLLLFLLIALNAIMVQRYNLKRLFFILAIAVSGVSLLMLSNGLLQRTEARMVNNPISSRLMDVTESGTAQEGGETRLNLFQHWVPIVASAPWYGYGFGAMAGSADETGKIIRKHLFPVGTHNTYIGILIEVGPIGFIAFLMVLMHYAKIDFAFRGNVDVKWALISFLACNIIILVVSHSHLFCFEGKTAFTLFFLLPTSPALRKQTFAL